MLLLHIWEIISEKYNFEIGTIVDWKIHGLLSRIFGIQGYFSKKSTKKLIGYIEEIKPDVIHLNNVHSNYLNLPLLFKYLSNHNIATVITLHDCWFYTGKCTHYTVNKCNKWKIGCGNCPRKREDNKSWIFDRTPKMWRDKKYWYESIPKLGVIGVSDWITNEAKSSIMGTSKIIRRIYNWIDLDTFKPQPKSIGTMQNKFIILGVASGWSKKKGFEQFIKLASYLKEDELIVLVGNIPDCTLPNNIVHISATNNCQELVKYYSVANVFLQLSREESFGKVVAESLACGTPVITIDSTANKELVPEKCGVVIDEPDLDSIYDAITYIKNKKKKTYSKNCRQFAMENFDMNKRIDDYISLYKEILCD